MTKDPRTKELALLRGEPRYCLLEELEPYFMNLWYEIKREGFTEKRRVLGNKLSKLLFSKSNDSYVLVMSELFNDTITYATKITEETGIDKRTVQYYLDEMVRYKIVQKHKVKDIENIHPGKRARLVLYSLSSITDQMRLNFLRNEFPEMFVDPEEEKEEKSQKSTRKKTKELVLCSFCNYEIGNGMAYCNHCGIQQKEPEGNDCPNCGNPLLRYCASCGQNRVVKRVEVEA